ncbi:MAG: DUF1049 domain-containing protein [Azospirillum brasilense]|nr:MAG: DUF1049 domain-containing protein [Azospirillum brasilense]
MWRWLLIGPLLIVLVLFALSNTAPVPVRFWPFDLAWETPLAVAVLSVSALAFLLGALVTWMTSLGARRRARHLAQTVRQLESELAQLRAQVARQVPEGSDVPGRRPAKVALPAP